jgi:hypothetical protein
MTPSRAQLAALVAALLLLSPTVYGCVIFKAALDSGFTLTGSLVDNGGQICTLKQGLENPPHSGMYTFACVDGYSMTWTEDESVSPPLGSVTYNTPHGQFVFATPFQLNGNNCWLACNYNCAGPCNTC